jgi:hypothetical protein
MVLGQLGAYLEKHEDLNPSELIIPVLLHWWFQNGEYLPFFFTNKFLPYY